MSLLQIARTLALAVSTAGLARAQDPGRIPIETYTLPNGLRVVLAEDHSAQVVAVDMWYDVGSRNEVSRADLNHGAERQRPRFEQHDLATDRFDGEIVSGLTKNLA